MPQEIDFSELSEHTVRAGLTDFLEARTRKVWEPDTDLFKSGAVTSLFAMELVVHVEETFGVTVEGEDLSMEHFRTIDDMVSLVTRLRSVARHG